MNGILVKSYNSIKYQIFADTIFFLQESVLISNSYFMNCLFIDGTNSLNNEFMSNTFDGGLQIIGVDDIIDLSTTQRVLKKARLKASLDLQSSKPLMVDDFPIEYWEEAH